MKTYDIRSRDIVKFKSNLTDDDRSRMMKFAKRVSGQEEMNDYVYDMFQNNLNNFTFKVDKCKHTQKVPTEYAVIVTPEHVLVPIQTRYLVLVNRKSRHPLTNIFQ